MSMEVQWSCEELSKVFESFKIFWTGVVLHEIFVKVSKSLNHLKIVKDFPFTDCG